MLAVINTKAKFKRGAFEQQNIFHMVNKTKLKFYHPMFKFGSRIPIDHNHAIKLDHQNGNTNWQDAAALEMQQLYKYGTFKNHGLATVFLSDSKRLRFQLVIDVKHDRHHKVSFVTDGHMTDRPEYCVYSSVVSLHGLCLIIFLAEANDF